MQMRNYRTTSGFTIVELLIVIVVIGVLAAITIVSYTGITQRAIVSSLQSDLDNAAKLLKLGLVMSNEYPSDLSTINGGKAFTGSGDNTILYSRNNNVSPQIFCINASKGTNSYIITSDGVPSTGVCPGLLASYYANINLIGSPAVRQMELIVYHNWGIGAPGIGLPVDDFSVSYDGYVTATVDGTYTFYVTSDDGQRLYLDGNLLVDDWIDHGAITQTVTIDLTAGQKVPISYQMYENSGGAVAELEWMVPGGLRVAIPASALSQT